MEGPHLPDAGVFLHVRSLSLIVTPRCLSVSFCTRFFFLSMSVAGMLIYIFYSTVLLGKSYFEVIFFLFFCLCGGQSEPVIGALTVIYYL